MCNESRDRDRESRDHDNVSHDWSNGSPDRGIEAAHHHSMSDQPIMLTHNSASLSASLDSLICYVDSLPANVPR